MEVLNCSCITIRSSTDNSVQRAVSHKSYNMIQSLRSKRCCINPHSSTNVTRDKIIKKTLCMDVKHTRGNIWMHTKLRYLSLRQTRSARTLCRLRIILNWILKGTVCVRKIWYMWLRAATSGERLNIRQWQQRLCSYLVTQDTVYLARKFSIVWFTVTRHVENVTRHTAYVLGRSVF